MSLLKKVSELGINRTFNLPTLACINQIRFATKKVSGSKTNKNDSAGRRLGPKAYEDHFVKPGQIIMRQRGTKIHPGENVGIGRDHTIFALEPGYVKFYYDPFHPLRKYVGVALKRELKLPTPHFEPRVRRFGYEVLTDPLEAKKEETHMSRKEYYQQPEIKKNKQEFEEQTELLRSEYTKALPDFGLNFSAEDSQLSVDRLVNIANLVKAGQSVEEARSQTTYNHYYNMKLAVKRGESTSDALASEKDLYMKLVEQVDSKIGLDANLKLCAYLRPAEREAKKQEIAALLKKDYSGVVLSKETKQKINELIETPGVFSQTEQTTLKGKFLPKVLPLDVAGTTVEVKDPSKPPKGIVVTRIFDQEERKVTVVGRTQEAFA